MTRKCSGCHNDELALGGIKDIANPDYLARTGLVRFGDPEGSLLYQSVKNRRMPLSKDYLDEVELDIVRTFIAKRSTVAVDNSMSCTVTAAALRKPIPARLWPITRAQYANILADVFNWQVNYFANLPDPQQVDGLLNHSGQMVFDDFVVTQLNQISEAISKDIAENASLGAVWPCNAGVSPAPTAACIAEFVNRIGLRLFRRPLTPDEATRLQAVYAMGADDAHPARGGARLVLQAMLFSPNFIYRKEFGVADGASESAMTNYQIAESLAFHILDSAPDEELLASASRLELTQPAARGAQIKRLLKTPRGKKMVARLLADMIDLESLPALKLGIANEDRVKASMVKEFELFVEKALGRPDSLVALFSSSKSSIDAWLASQIYGLTGYDSGFRETEFSAFERSGFLTLPAFLAVTSDATGGKAVLRRGKFVREKVLCQKLGSPPPIDVKEPQLPANFEQLSPREQFEARHLVNASCAGCHKQIDPIGFGMGNFSSWGGYTPVDPVTNRNVDVRGFVAHTAGSDFAFTGAAELSRGLSHSMEAQECFATNAYTFVIGKRLETGDKCGLQRHQKKFVESGGNILELIENLLNDPALYLRGGA